MRKMMMVRTDYGQTLVSLTLTFTVFWSIYGETDEHTAAAAYINVFLPVPVCWFRRQESLVACCRCRRCFETLGTKHNTGMQSPVKAERKRKIIIIIIVIARQSGQCVLAIGCSDGSPEDQS